MADNPVEVQLSDEQKKIFDVISAGRASELANALSQYKGSVNFIDENGITPIQNAAFKGDKEMVQMLLDRGADANLTHHQNNYTALHFGGLSGNSQVCLLLLQAGVKPAVLNSVGRTAAQMAAFVGNHHVVVTINNFVDRSEVAYFGTIQGQQSEPHLVPHLVDPLHKVILEYNLHPVHIALTVQRLNLLDDIEQLSKVLEMMCKREMTKGANTNEVIAFKYHYISYVLKELSLVKNKTKEEEKKVVVETFCKKLLKPGKDKVSLDLLDAFLKECVREYPFRECTIFHHMVTALASKDPPHAYSVIRETINGSRIFIDSVVFCSTCGAEQPAKKCSKCKMVQYCDRECQRIHWFVHKKTCSRVVNPPAKSAAKDIDADELTKELQNMIAG